MPTGYTADVQDGKITTLDQFAWQCARAFGACISMRDDSQGTSIPERFEPDTKYYDAAIESAEGEIARIEAATDAEAEAGAADQYDAEIAARDRRRNEKAEYRARYQAMLDKVKAWRVDKELDGLRAFMIEQLEQSMDFDCSDSYQQADPVKLTGQDWRARRLAHEQQTVAYRKVEREKEIQRVAGRNAWLAQLRHDLLEIAE